VNVGSVVLCIDADRFQARQDLLQDLDALGRQLLAVGREAGHEVPPGRAKLWNRSGSLCVPGKAIATTGMRVFRA
jgi:hypothetical protein